jgi:inosose dehydratase
VQAEARAQGWSFLEALRHIIFCEFGAGIVDIPRVIDVLKANDYAGWVIVEQDTSARDSTESAKASRAYLRRVSGI